MFLSIKFRFPHNFCYCCGHFENQFFILGIGWEVFLYLFSTVYGWVKFWAISRFVKTMLKRKSNTYCLYIVYEMVAKNKTENYQTFRKHRNFSHTFNFRHIEDFEIRSHNHLTWFKNFR